MVPFHAWYQAVSESVVAFLCRKCKAVSQAGDLLLVRKVLHISQGGVAKYLRCDGIFNAHFVRNLLLSLTVSKILKIGKHLAKFWVRV